MPDKPESPAIEAEAQQVLDELWNKGRIPFPLKVGKITKEPNEDPNKYSIQFYDSRIQSVSVLFTEGMAFRLLLQATILARVAKLNAA